MALLIKTALISVYHKDGLEEIVNELTKHNVKLISTGGTGKFIERLGHSYTPVEELTNYPEIFGGRVKTLHPAIFGGILYRRGNENDEKEAKTNKIESIDLVIVDLYPFTETVVEGGSHDEIIEKIDIGGIALIRATAKNYKHTLIISNRTQYSDLVKLIKDGNTTTEDQRKHFAAEAFDVSSSYDRSIEQYLGVNKNKELRYGENPHQKGFFKGNLEDVFTQLHGKELSYNNLLDVDAAVSLIKDFDANRNITFAVLKHNNACGIAHGTSVRDAYLKAFAADTLSAFGGILVCNHPIDKAAAEEMNSLFYEVIIAPSFDEDALEIIKTKKNRIVLELKDVELPKIQERTLLNGKIVQDRDSFVDTVENLELASKIKPSDNQITDALFALKIVKHTKSNAIVLVKDGQLLASGTGQTSRVDALQQALAKAKHFGMNLKGSTMASDAFFPFPDCVEIADKDGIAVVVHPGGSRNDQASIDYCDNNEMIMLLNGYRHFKH